MRNVSYENSQGTVMQLNDGAYFVNANDLRDFVWEYTPLSRPSGLGGKMRSFSRPVLEKTINVGIRGTSSQFAERMNALHALTEVDILAKTPGKLWYNEQYLICYLGVSSEISTLSERGHFAEKALKIAVVEPFWCKNILQRFLIASETASEGGKKYDGRYAYKYGTSYQNSTLYNTHYAACPMILTMYGPVTNPSIVIGGNTYAITTEIASGERVEVDQIAGTIYKISSSGIRSSIFNLRDKDNNIFANIVPGALTVSWSGDYAFDVTMIQQRSEPLWT